MTAKTVLRLFQTGPMVPVILALLVSSAVGDIWNTPSLTVHLASGRQFTGQLDPRSDGDWLWLRMGSPSAYVVRPIAWDRVVRAERAGEIVPVAQLQEDVLQLENVAPRAGNVGFAAEDLPEKGTNRCASAVCWPRVTSIWADAWAANWDADVENDGILVQVVALDTNGFPVPASGRLEVYLIGPRKQRFSDSPTSRGVRFDRLGHWARRVGPEDMQDTEMAYRLPYQATNPQFDPRLGSHAQVNVRLAVPGSGTFERTVDYVRIEPFSPLRDYHQLHTGRRWLDVEQPGLGARVPSGF